MRNAAASDIISTVRDPVPIANPNFAAVLLAGGRSTRMGRDKATLVIEGQPLWQRQLDKLRALEPCELFISGRCAGPYASAGVEIIEDSVPGLGPLGGVAAALRRATSPRVLVLAVDLPRMSAEFLASLLREPHPTIPRHGNFFEPLAAIYPKCALPVAEEMLGQEDRSMQRFVRGLLERNWVQARTTRAAEVGYFKNLNHLDDCAPDGAT